MFNWNQSLGRIDKTNNQPSHDARFRHTENVFGNVHTHDDVVDDVHLSLSLSLVHTNILRSVYALERQVKCRNVFARERERGTVRV